MINIVRVRTQKWRIKLNENDHENDMEPRLVLGFTEFGSLGLNGCQYHFKLCLRDSMPYANTVFYGVS